MMVRRWIAVASLMGVASLGYISIAEGGGDAAKKAEVLPDGIKAVTTEQLKVMLDQKTAQVFDSRSQDAFTKSHVDGAMNLPADEFDAKKLPVDKATPLVFYCGGPACSLAPACAKKAKAAGYTNVFVYSDGIDGWQRDGKKS